MHVFFQNYRHISSFMNSIKFLPLKKYLLIKSMVTSHASQIRQTRISKRCHYFSIFWIFKHTFLQKYWLDFLYEALNRQYYACCNSAFHKNLLCYFSSTGILTERNCHKNIGSLDFAPISNLDSSLTSNKIFSTF